MDLFKVKDKNLYVSKDGEVICGSYAHRETSDQFFVTVHGMTFCFSDGFDFSEKESYGERDVSGKIICYKFIVKSLFKPIIITPYQRIDFHGVLQEKFESTEQQEYILKIMEFFIKKKYKYAYRWDIDVVFQLSEDVQRNIFDGVYLK